MLLSSIGHLFGQDGWGEGLRSLHGWQEVRVWIIFGESCFVLAANVVAALDTRRRKNWVTSTVYALSATLCFALAVGYMVLLLGPFSYPDWAKAFGNLSLFLVPIGLGGHALTRNSARQAVVKDTVVALETQVETQITDHTA